MVSTRGLLGVWAALSGLSGCYGRTSCGEWYTPIGGPVSEGLSEGEAEQLMCAGPLVSPQVFGFTVEEGLLVAGETAHVRPVALGPGAEDLTWTFEICDEGLGWDEDGWKWRCGGGSRNWRVAETTADGAGILALEDHGDPALEGCGDPSTWHLDQGMARAFDRMAWDCLRPLGVRATGRNADGVEEAQWSMQLWRHAERWDEGPEPLTDLDWRVTVDEPEENELVVTLLAPAPWDHVHSAHRPELYVGEVGNFRAFPIGASLNRDDRSGLVAALDGQIGLVVSLGDVRGDEVTLGLQMNVERAYRGAGSDPAALVLRLARGEQGWIGEVVEP